MESLNHKVQQGTLKVSEEVIATIVKLAVLDVQGVDSLMTPNVSLEKIFFKQNGNSTIKIKLSGDVVEISLSILVKYGNKVTALAEAVQNRVKSDVQSMTGITVSRVNVLIGGIVFDSTEK